MYCSQCGSPISDNAQFCPQCGKNLSFTKTSSEISVVTQEFTNGYTKKMSVWEGFITCLKKYAVFSGRARRTEFWGFVLFYVIFSMIVNFVDDACNTEVFGGIYFLALFIPYLAIGWRRMHDIGRCGAWSLLPIVNIVFACFDTVKGPNKYGEDPKYC